MAQALVKVIVASEWQFTEPNEVIAQFTSMPLGNGRNIQYDETLHQFVVDCPVSDTAAIAGELQEVVRTYIDEAEINLEQGRDIGDARKIRPLLDPEYRVRSQNEEIWREVNRKEAQMNGDNGQAQLVPQITKYKTGKFSPNDMATAFPQLTLMDIAQLTGCTVDLVVDGARTRIRVVGFADSDVEQAIGMLNAAEVEYETAKQASSFDFYDVEGHPDPFFRFQRPAATLDPQSFGKGNVPLCELTMAEWLKNSRQYRLLRKNINPIDYALLQETLWTEPLEFQYNDEANDPKHWQQRQEPMPQGEPNLRQLGRTQRWIERMDNVEEAPVALPSKKTIRRKLSRTGQAAPETAQVDGVPMEEPDEAGKTAMGSRQLRPRDVQLRERIKEDSESDDSSDLEPLQAPARRHALLEGAQWPFIRFAMLNSMRDARQLHRRALSYELRFGKAYVHTVSIKDDKHKPRKDVHTTNVFQDSDWPHIFRIKVQDRGATVQLSNKITTSALDAEFLLNMKMRGGESIFTTTTIHRRAYFEILCVDTRTKVEAVIEIPNGDEPATIEGNDESKGQINFHYPCRTWDCSWYLQARRQGFPTEQEEVFATFTRHAFVKQGHESSRDPELFSKRHDRVQIRHVRLIRETTHRAPSELSLVLKQIKVLEVQHMGDRTFKASALDSIQLSEQSKVWWEAKLVNHSLHEILSENRDLEIGEAASWDPVAGTREEFENVFRSMIELGQHVITRTDAVGHGQHVRLDKASAHDKTASQARSQAGSQQA